MPTTSPAAAPSPVSTAGTVPVGSALPKVLRIGIIVEGKIVQERLVRAGTSVTLGGPASTFDVVVRVMDATREVSGERTAVVKLFSQPLLASPPPPEAP